MMDQPISAAESAAAAERLEQTLFEVKKIIVGQDRVVERLLVCLLARGHALLEGVPGLAKTLAAETIARVVGGSFTRIQFTPDLLPADVMGTRIYRAGTEAFDVELGPVFANFVLADEINRAPAKVQSALLEVMAEHQVSIGGQTFEVPEPFLVLATQNPIEQEGVYPLPEAQRDRFLMKIVVEYPTPGEEVEIVQRMGVKPRRRARPSPSAPWPTSSSRPTGCSWPGRSWTTPSTSCSPRASRTGSASATSPSSSSTAPAPRQPRPRRRRPGPRPAARTVVRAPQDVYDARPTSSATGWCSPTRRSPATCPSTTSWAGSSPPSRRPAWPRRRTPPRTTPVRPRLPETAGASPWPTAPAPTGWDGCREPLGVGAPQLDARTRARPRGRRRRRRPRLGRAGWGLLR
ncbi:MAG: AAA family ATPase [Acidimicrobiales bacterium]